MKKHIINYIINFTAFFLAVFIGFLAIEIFFRSGPFFIILFSIPIGFIFALPFGLIFTIIFNQLNVKVGVKTATCLFAPLFISVVLVGWYLYSPPDKIFIQRYVTGTTLMSIKNVRSKIEYPSKDSIVRISFNINENDFDRLIKYKNYHASNDDFPLKVPIINNYKWWSFEQIQKLPQNKAKTKNKDFEYLWYDQNRHLAYYMRIGQ